MGILFGTPSFVKKLTKGIIVLILGVLAVANPSLTTETLLIIIGYIIVGYTLFSSALSYIAMRKQKISSLWQFQGVFGLIIGIVLISYPNSVIGFVISFLGFVLFFIGFTQFIASLQAKLMGSISWVSLLISVLILTGSVVMISKPELVAEKFVIFFGVMAIFSSISDIVMAFKIRNRIPNNSNQSTPNIIDIDYEEVK